MQQSTIDNKFCSKCSYPLTPQAYEELKANEDIKLRMVEQKHELDMKAMREEMNQQFSQIISMIQQNPKLTQIKPEALIGKI